jgi:hypothetical protein
MLVVWAPALAACEEAGGLKDSCDKAASAIRVKLSAELNPDTIGDKFERIAEVGDAETRDVFNPTIRKLRNLTAEGKLDHSYMYPVLDRFLARCGLPLD